MKKLSYENFTLSQEDNIKADACYFGEISRSSAEEFLKNWGTCEGTYLVRDGSDGMRLSVLTIDDEGECEVLHYKISRNSNSTYSIEPQTSFPTVASLIRYYKGKQSGISQVLTEPCPSTDPESEDLYLVPDTLNDSGKVIKKEFVKFKSLLREGGICYTWKGQLTTTSRPVLIKEFLRTEKYGLNHLLQESKAVSQLDHRNIVKYIGRCSTDETMFLLYDYFPNGGLLDQLLHNNELETSANKFRYSMEIADALEYISKQNYVHRNVKASSILMSRNCICKLSGFDHIVKLNVDGRYSVNPDDRPFSPNAVRWQAPEGFQSQAYVSKSDVWSYACTIFEIFSNGETPYSQVHTSSVMDHVLRGRRIEQTPEMSFPLFQLLQKCCNIQATSRPGFHEIQLTLKDLIPLVQKREHVSSPPSSPSRPPKNSETETLKPAAKVGHNKMTIKDIRKSIKIRLQNEDVTVQLNPIHNS